MASLQLPTKYPQLPVPLIGPIETLILGILTLAVSVQTGGGDHLVAVPTGVEWRAVDGRLPPLDGSLHLLGVHVDPPHQLRPIQLLQVLQADLRAG